MVQRLHLEFCFFRAAIARFANNARRPATQLAALAAVLFVSCCIAESDAQIARNAAPAFAAMQIVGDWHATSYDDAVTQAGAQDNDVAASAQTMLTTPKYDDAAMTVPEHVSALHIDTEIHSHRVTILAPLAMHFSAHLAPGERRVVNHGTNGAAWITERVTRWNDVVVSRQTLSRQVVRSAVPGVEVIGTPRTLAQLRRAFPKDALATVMTMVATAYTADTATAYPTGYTATGVLAHQGIVAVDPHVIPLGTTLFVPGYGIAVAADTGSAIIGNRIDLCMDSYSDAMDFGRRTVQVYVLKR